MKLWYTRPAQDFNEALPIGNGTLGAMVFGGVQREELRLNEDSLWSGYDRPQQMNPGAADALPEIRRLLFAGEPERAHRLIRAHLLCDRLEAYQPLGTLLIQHDDTGTPTAYQRSLDLDSGVTRTRFTLNTSTVTREAFCSYPDRALVLRITSDSAPLTVSATFACPHPHQSQHDESGFLLHGRCPVHADPNYLHRPDPIRYDPKDTNRAIEFTVRARITRTPHEILIVLAAASSLRPDPVLPDGNWDELLARHTADYAALWNRCRLDLGEGENRSLPTDERLAAFVNHPERDASLPALLFAYGRYLLIASSRPGSRAANLQGIWNDCRRPPWSSNYTVNINTEMNYWGAEAANLSECHQPLMEMIGRLRHKGAEVARHYYNCAGWAAHHNVDGWDHAVPMGGWGDPEDCGTVTFGMWPMGGAWLCQHLWMHYTYTLDVDFLQHTALPAMRGAVEFGLDFLVRREDAWVTCPSTSPENRYVLDGKLFGATYASTMDMAILRDLFANYLAACDALGFQDALSGRVKSVLEDLLPYQIGPHGELMEWPEPFEESEIHHRHVSHLFGLHPGSSIRPETAPHLAEACRQSLIRRGDGGTGWSLGWKINLWARLNDGEHAFRLLKRQLLLAGGFDVDYGHVGGGSYPNLLGAHPPFQIDGNFGALSGICEMLLRSTEPGEVRLLPAHPDAWREGQVTGLRARGGITVDIRWQGGKFCEAHLCADTDLTARVFWGEKALDVRLTGGEQVRIAAEAFA